MIIKRIKGLSGEISIPGDKSISHRSIMLGSLAKGDTEVYGFLQGADCLSSISCFKAMGVDIENDGSKVIIHGNGLYGLRKPSDILDVGNSGTTIRLMSGILAAQDFDVRVDGDASIRKRPMGRIMNPLRLMGADIRSVNDNGCAPLAISGRKLKGIHYESPVASAQVKSGVLFAGLYAEGETSVTEPYVSRNHTELMLKDFGADIRTVDKTVTVAPAKELYARRIDVPGDISSAAYFIATGLITDNSCITIKNVGINPTRDGILEVCSMMGADIIVEEINHDSAEPVADITVRTSSLRGCVIGGELIPRLIDEIPVIAVMACFAEGTTTIKNAGELKVKESNRIDTIVNNLKAMGADIEATDDGMIINGKGDLKGASIDCKADHRIAMSFTVAGLNADGETDIVGSECVDISFPGFFDTLNMLVF